MSIISPSFEWILYIGMTFLNSMIYVIAQKECMGKLQLQSVISHDLYMLSFKTWRGDFRH